MNIIKFISSMFILILFNALYIPAVSAKSLTASVDRKEVSINDTFTLKVEAEGVMTLSQPDLSFLADSFDVVGKDVRHNIQRINGTNSQSIIWQLQLRPKKMGRLIIPPLELSGVKSNAIEMNVTKQSIVKNDNEDFLLQTALKVG